MKVHNHGEGPYSGKDEKITRMSGLLSIVCLKALITYDLCIGDLSCQLTMGECPFSIVNRFLNLNVKAVVAAFNQEKALVG